MKAASRILKRKRLRERHLAGVIENEGSRSELDDVSTCADIRSNAVHYGFVMVR